MTNLLRWLFYLVSFIIPYFSVLFIVVTTPDLQEWLFPLQLVPYLLVLIFGLYAASTVLYRTFTFNDCPLAAKELHEQIEEARKDLIQKGFKFRD